MKYLLFLLVILAALMPAIPEPTNPLAIGVAAISAMTLAVWCMKAVAGAYSPVFASGAWLIVFMNLVFLSSVTADQFGTPFNLWVRGAIPFFFLLMFFPALQIAIREPDWMVHALHLSSIAWLIAIITAAAAAVPAVLSGDVQRITHATEAWSAFQLPYAMVGLALTLFYQPRWLNAVRWPLAYLFSCIPLMSVSRGQIAAVAAIWLLYIARVPRRTRLRVAAPVFLVGVSMAALIGQSALHEALLERFINTGASENSRWLELEYAFARFLESPVLGKGLGHQIPAEVTFAGDWKVISDAGIDTVGYMHNVIGYILMNLGLSGLIAYLGFIVTGVRDVERRCLSQYRSIRLASIVIVLALIWWSMIQAAFRLVQSNIILAVSLAVLTALKVRTARGRRSDAQRA